MLPSSRRTWLPFAVAPLGGLAFALAAPPEGVPGLAWLGFAPIWWAIFRTDVTPRRAAWIAWAGGFPAVFVGFRWITYTVRIYAEFDWPLALALHVLFSAWHTIPFALWGFGLRAVHQPSLALRIVWAAAWWVALSTSWLHIFPHTVVIGFARHAPWMQAAEFGGPSLVELEVLVAGVLLVESLSLRGRRRIVLGVAATFFPLLSHLWGAHRMEAIRDELDGAPTVRVGLVQPNIPLRWRDAERKLERLHAMSVAAERQGAELVVWPEAGMYPHRLPHELTADPPDPEYRILRDHGVPTVLGVATQSARGEKFNSAIFVDRDHQFIGHFDKVHLVPFGEHVPLVDPTWLLERIPAMSHLTPGYGPTRFVLRTAAGAYVMGPLICYEDIIPSFALDVAGQSGGIDMFVNVTIDTWFGPVGQAEHLALAQFRSVEHRIPLLRSVSSGVTAVVSPTGEVTESLPSREVSVGALLPPEVLVADVPIARRTSERPTFYAAYGWWIRPISLLLVLVFVLARFVWPQREPLAVPA